MARSLIFIQKRPSTGVWAGLWEFPGGTIEGAETPEQIFCPTQSGATCC